MPEKKVVVLGANSFSGQDFIDLLLDDPETSVIGISRSVERSDLFLKYKLRSNQSRYRYVQLDLNKNMDDLLALLDQERPEEIVNFAAQSEVAPSWDHPEHWFQTNCVSLARLVNHLRKHADLKRYLHISSPEAYGNCVGKVTEETPLNPSTPYAASKVAADLLLRTFFKQFGFPLLTVRATNVYGARQQLFKIIPRTVIYLKSDRKIQLHGGGKAVKSYIHIRDVSKGELAILEKGKVGQLYHISPDRGIAVRDVVKSLCDKIGKNFEQSVEVVSERPGQDDAYVIDSTRAKSELGWAPRVSLDEGLTEVIEWIEKYWNRIKNERLDYVHKA